MQTAIFRTISLSFLFLVWSIASLQAQLSLNFDDGLVPGGTALYGTGTVQAAGGVGDTGYLQLTLPIGNENSSFIIDEIVPGERVQRFTLSAKVRVDQTSARPADGFSVSLGSDMPDGTVAEPENGLTATGLVVTFDTWDNNGVDTAPAIEVWNAGVVIISQAMDGPREGGRAPSGPFLTDPSTGEPLNLFTSPSPWTGDGTFEDLIINLDGDGTIDVTWKGVPVFTDVATGYIPAPGRFAIAGRTGGAWERLSVDDLSIEVYQAGAPIILVPPQDQTVGQGYTATFTVAVDGTPPYSYQWRVGGADIPGATGYSYTTPPTTPDMDGSVYDVVVSNGQGSITSAGATLNLILDSTPPEVVSVVGTPSLRSVIVTFNEELEFGALSSAEDPFNYGLDPFVVIQSATLSEDHLQVTLATDAQSSGALYTLTVGGVRDVAGNPMPETNVQFNSFTRGPGIFFADFDDGLVPAGTQVAGTATVAATGGLNDSGVMQLATAASSQNGSLVIEDFNEGLPVYQFVADFKILMGGTAATATPADGASFCYGPDVTGLFGEEGVGTLRVSFDNYDNDNIDTAPAIEVFYRGASIAVQSMDGPNGGVPPRTPLITDPATGGPMSLMTGTDFANVLIRLNRDDTLDVFYKDVQIFAGLPVPGLSGLNGARFGLGGRTGGLWADHFVDDVLIMTLTPGPVTILEPPQDQTVGQGFTATFSVVVDGSRPYAYQWRKDGVDIPGATGFSYTTPPTTPDMDQSLYDVVVSNVQGTIVSTGARLTVIGDTTPPEVLSAVGSPNLDSILVTFNEPLEAGELSSAEDPFNYGLDPFLVIQSAVLSGDQTKVTLYTDPQTSGTLYTLTVGGVRDVAGNPMPETQVQFTGFVLGPTCFFANFNDGQVPPGSAVYGTAIADTVGGVNDSGCLKVATASGNQNGSFVIYDLQNGQRVTGFEASFQVQIGGPAATYPRIADGFSFNFAADLPDDVISPAEDGAGSGLSITLDTWDSGGVDTAPALEVVYNGEVLATQIMDGIRADTRPRGGSLITDPATGLPMNLITGQEANQFAEMRVVLYNNLLLDVWFKDVPIFTALPVPYLPIAGGKFMFAARTGGAWADHFVDDVYICTTSEPAEGVTVQVTQQPQGATFGVGCDIAPPTPRFITDFNQGLPPGSAVYGSSSIAASGGVNDSGFLVITPSANSQNGSYIIADFTEGEPVPGFVANFKVRVSDSTCCTSGPDPRPADGFSFNFSPSIPDGTLMGEEGVGTGLVISFDVWDNNATDSDPAISVKFNGAELGVVSMGEPSPTGPRVTEVPIDPATGLPMTITTGPQFVDAQVRLDNDGTVDVTYKGVLVLANVPTPYVPTAGRFAFGARTGGANEAHLIDNLSIVVNEPGGEAPVVPTSDVTQPGDAIVGTSGNTPAAEGVVNVIDNQDTTKYLNFDKLNTGFTVTPSMGLSIVSGLTLTSANDAPDRDPASYTLEGSMDGVNFTMIAGGTVPAFPERFLKQTILFENQMPYLQYRLIFPTVANEGGANSMQIAEVELLGSPLSDVTVPADPIVGTSANTPGAEGVEKAIDNQSSTKYLNFDKLNTGFTVTPGMGDTVVTGLSLISANDAPERDPASYTLEGSNDGATFTLISSGTVPAFATRFEKQYIFFPNTTPFKAYRLIFPTVANEAAANSMQIAEVELLGVASAAEGEIVLLDEDFTSGDGGFTVNTPQAYDGPWVYDAVSGSWGQNGQQTENSRPNTSMLNSPTLTILRSGEVILTFQHRHSFEGGFWDGGQVLVSINGGSYQVVPSSAFTEGGYNGSVRADSASILAGQACYVEESAGYDAGFITSVANLGVLAAGDTVSVQFLAAADTNTRGPKVPNWQIDSVTLNLVELPVARFAVAGTATLDGRTDVPVYFQWQRDDGAGFQDIPGATGSELVLAVTPADNGTLVRALVGAAGVFEPSASALLVVTYAPEVIVTGPADGSQFEEADAVTLVASASDADGEVVAVEFFADIVGSIGMATQSGGDWILAIPSAPPGLFQITAVATDNDGIVCASPSILVEVIPNEPPVCQPVVAETLEDTPVDITLLASDPNNEPLTYVITADPDHGTVILNGNIATYAPSANYNGPDQFGFKAIDPRGGQSGQCAVQITVLPVNDPPSCANTSATTCEDVAVNIELQAGDVDGDPLDYEVVMPPANGTVSITGNIATYQGNTDYNGSDSFTFKVTDPGGLESGDCLVSITIQPGNDSPVAVITISPTVDLGPTVPGINVVSPNNIGACVTLDGSQSSDVDNDFADLSFTWLVDGVVVGTGPVLSDVCLLIGEREVTLLVDDGSGEPGECDEPSEGERIEMVNVISGAEAAEELLLQINDAIIISRKTKQQFISTAKNAAAAFERGSYGAGMNMLRALINKFEAQLRDDPDIQAAWIDEAQSIIDGMSEPVTCEDCDESP